MDDALIRDLGEGFRKIRGLYKERKRCLDMDSFCEYCDSLETDARDVMVEVLTPILAKHTKPDRVEEIKRLLNKLEEDGKGFANIMLFGDGTGGVWREGNLRESIPRHGGPENAIRFLISKSFPVPTTPVPVTIEIDGRKVTGTFTPDEE